jgi:transcriptional regulator with XRE-family HTH domain
MSRVEKELSCADGCAVKLFATELRRVRAGAGLPYRELAKEAHYSHSSLVRAASGESLPNWDVTEAFLKACRIPCSELPAWQQLWNMVDELTRSGRALDLRTGLSDCLEQVRAFSLGQGETA